MYALYNSMFAFMHLYLGNNNIKEYILVPNRAERRFYILIISSQVY